MKGRMLSLAVGVALAMGSASAFADNSNYMDGGNNILDIGESYLIGEVVTGMFMDQHTFALGSFGETGVQAITFDFLTNYDFSDISATLRNAANEIIGFVSVDTPPQYFSLTPDSSYVLQVQGTTAGIGGGVYVAAVTPVPEPAQWGLLLAGLGLVGWSQRTKRRGLSA